jgi:hypothetical protein
MWLEPTVQNLRILIALWVALSALLIGLSWTARKASAGLPLAYLFTLTLTHFYGALPYATGLYRPRHQMLLDAGNSLTTTFIGFEMALLGLAGLTVGWFVAGNLPARTTLAIRHLRPDIQKTMPAILLGLSLLFFFFLAPIMKRIPSMGSLGVAGIFLSVVAAILACADAIRKKDTKKLVWWLVGSTIAFPLITVVFMGFIGYGVGAATLVWVFVFVYYRPRWLSVLAMLFFVYGGLTTFVNYMASRNEIRASVWGERSLGHRLNTLKEIAIHFENFDPRNNDHMELVDSRLNQNHLVGVCAEYMAATGKPHTHGSTLAIAATAWIPRILWPGKPQTGGSGTLVSRYTGINFAAGTSVGVGQVMEYYINFGYWGVFLIFVVFGSIVRYFDIQAAQHLMNHDYWGYASWLLPSIGFMQAGGNSGEIVGSVASSAVFVFLLNKFYFSKCYLPGPERTRSAPAPFVRERRSLGVHSVRRLPTDQTPSGGPAR